MVQCSIATYARIRPCRKIQHNAKSSVSYTLEKASDEDLEELEEHLGEHSVREEDPSNIYSKVKFIIPDYSEDIYSKTQCDTTEFKFTRVFTQDCDQNGIFQMACKEVVMSSLDGYNGTIFAYGQTGSGKTFTITGGDKYTDRGIIPRAISTVFEEFEERKEINYSCFISYLEIYNENVYDLLDRTHTEVPIENWNKVQLAMDDDSGDLHFRNLGVYEASSEEEALNLLFLGNVNRVTSDTPMNEASSRSHSIFCMIIEGRPVNSEIVTTSKLHLVDLAGSERVFKHDGTKLSRKEGRYINLSLHYLEQVVTALQEQNKGTKMMKKRGHIPYRNSMLTSVLRGSLGGNCKSIFIATLNPESDFLQESISTCRFMQRCRQVKIDVSANSEVDNDILLRRLKKENKELKKLNENLIKKAEVYKLEAKKKEVIAITSSDTITCISEEEQNCTKAPNNKELDWDYCEELVEEYLIEEDDKEKHITLDEIEKNGLPTAIACCALLKSNVVYASEAAADARNLIAAQNRNIEELNRRIEEQEIESQELQKRLQNIVKAEEDNSKMLNDVVEEKNRIQNAYKEIKVSKEREVISRDSQNSSETASDIIRRRIELLKIGGFFLKHGRRGKPHIRYIWCSNDLKFLQYRGIGEKTAKIIIPSNTIQSIVLGQTTKVFERSGKEGRDLVSFSLIYDNGRTLDLEVDEGDSIEHNKRKAKEWTEAFKFLLKLNSAKKPIVEQ